MKVQPDKIGGFILFQIGYKAFAGILVNAFHLGSVNTGSQINMRSAKMEVYEVIFRRAGGNARRFKLKWHVDMWINSLGNFVAFSPFFL